VPGSHGPKQSGSVIVPTEVPTHTSTISFGSHFKRFTGGEDTFESSEDPLDEDIVEFDSGSPVNCALRELSFELFDELLWDVEIEI
jgi:hypothetical protein